MNNKTVSSNKHKKCQQNLSAKQIIQNPIRHNIYSQQNHKLLPK